MKNIILVPLKVIFGIGLEIYVIGSHGFYLSYALKINKICLVDTGYIHLTEVVSTKISAMLLYSERLALHASRPVRWDSDHFILLDDELREIGLEVVCNKALYKVMISLDFFVASISRAAEWVIGTHNMIKSL